MKTLHWLPIESRIQYKVLVLVHAFVHNVAPPYLSSILTSYVTSREMRSSGQLILHQPIPNMASDLSHIVGQDYGAIQMRICVT